MKKLKFLPVCILLIASGPGPSIAQNPKDELSQVMIDDSTDINTIALYPQTTRENIFKVSAYSEGIVKLADAQKKSQDSFRSLIASYNRYEQQKIWNLTRYNDLIAQLAAANGKSNKVEAVLKNFPAEIHDDALKYAVNHPELMNDLHRMNTDFNNSFQQIVSAYPEDVRKAFEEMMNVPEAFSLLNRNMHLTVHLGSIYKSDPAMMRAQFDSLNLVLAEQKAKENEEWKKEMQNNPEAQKELLQSADEYAKEEGIPEKDYTTTDPVVVQHYVYVPYPYWCGYPYWYATDYWYPYPYWYHSGFYTVHGEMVWIGPPSWFFLHWHFQHHHHYYHYPHLTNVYINHYYYGPRSVITRNRAEVQVWMRTNEKYLPRDFKSNHELRVDRIRELGKAETDLDNYQKNNPGKNITREEFIRQHPNDYPHLKQSEPAEIETPRKQDAVPGERQDKKQEPKIDHPKSTPREIKRVPAKNENREPVHIKSQPEKPKPGKRPDQPRNQQVNPKRVPVTPSVPAEEKKTKKSEGRK